MTKIKYKRPFSRDMVYFMCKEADSLWEEKVSWITGPFDEDYFNELKEELRKYLVKEYRGYADERKYTLKYFQDRIDAYFEAEDENKLNDLKKELDSKENKESKDKSKDQENFEM